MSEALRKPDWIPYYIQRIKGSSAWQLEDFKFCWYWKLLTEAADSSLPGYLVNDVRTLWRLAGARTEKFFRERGGMELVARYFSRTDDGLHIYNDKLLEVLHEQMKKLTRKRRSQTVSSNLSLSVLPNWIPKESWESFIEMREKKNKPLTERATRMLVKELETLKAQGHDPQGVIDQSTVHCWLSFYEIKPNEGAVNGQVHAKLVTRPLSMIERENLTMTRGR